MSEKEYSVEKIPGLRLNVRTKNPKDTTDKSKRKPLKSIYAERDKFQKIINYFEKFGGIYNATIELPNGKTAMIKPYGDKINIISDDDDKLNELEKILEKNERTKSDRKTRINELQNI